MYEIVETKPDEYGEKKKEENMTKFTKASTKIATLVLVCVAALAVSAKGQTLEHRIRVTIPFDFSVAGKTFAAGEYSVVRASQTNGDLILKISSSDEHSRAFPVTTPIERLNTWNKPVLIFHRYGNEYFLAQVWTAGSRTGRAFVKSRQERELEQRLRIASKTEKAPVLETVTLPF